MRLYSFSLMFNICCALLFGTKKITILDKSHLKTFANNWIEIWQTNPSPLSDIRINECWKSIIWCSENKHRPFCHCLSYKYNNFFIFVIENEKNKRLDVIGMLESPDNIYTLDEIDDIYYKLNNLSINSNYSLNLNPLQNWSHGMYLYQYYDKE